MYHTCLFCHADLGSNQRVEHLPIGSRLAFDPARGRLWIICRSCERWNLTPFEERWEAIEECERLFRGTKLRYSTSNIGLARLKDGLSLVRIGEPLRPEMAAWRYGDQFGTRRRRDLIVTGSAVAAASAGFLALNSMPWFAGLAVGYIGLTRRLIEVLWMRGKVPVVPGPEGTVVRLTARQVTSVEIWPHAASSGWLLAIPNAKQAGDATIERMHFRLLDGTEAISAVRTLLPIINHAGGRQGVVADAIQRIETAPDAEFWLKFALGKQRPTTFGIHGRQLGRQPADLRLALEMLVHEEFERRSLSGELWILEREWKKAEEIAGIADELLLPPEVDEQVARLKQL